MASSIPAASVPPVVTQSDHPTQAKVDRGLHSFEKVLNVPGYIPVVSSFSGPVRIAYGKLEIIGALAIGAMFIAKGLLSSDAAQRSKDMKYGFFVITHYSLQGLANIVRGIVESILFVNLLCIPYDFSGTRVRYPSELV